MNRLLLTLFLFSIIVPSFSQEKKRVFYNENRIEITKSHFDFLLNRGLEKDFLQIENDSLIAAFLLKRRGQLNDSIFKNLKKTLSPQKDLTNDLIIIFYYPGKDNCNASFDSSFFKNFGDDYLRILKKIGTYDSFWIYKNNGTANNYLQQHKKWLKDQDQTVEKLFFEFHYLCYSAVVISKTGKYICRFGKFGNHVIDGFSTELLGAENTKNKN